MSHDAFVSYASSDRVVAYRMVDYLESCGIRCWVAPRDVPGGRNYAEAILDALNEAQLFLLIFSEESNGSEHVQREVERALHLHKPIVPVRIVDVMPSGAMDYYLATLHWLDAFCTDSGDSSDENAAGVELGCQDVTRAVGSLLGREDEVEKAIAAIIRAKQEAEERRKQEAEEREMRIRLEAEAHAQAELEAAAKAKAEIEAEDRRLREADERQRKAEQDQRERERERQREEREREDQRKLEKENKREAAATGGSTSSTGKLIATMGVLLALLIGGGWWAVNHFDSGGGAQPAPLVHPPASDPPSPSVTTPVLPERVAKVRAAFFWAEQEHFVADAELLKLNTESSSRTLEEELREDRREIRILPIIDGEDGNLSDEGVVEAAFELAIPGFAPISRRVVLEEGEQDIDFGPLVRLQGEMKLISSYTDHPRAAEAHSEWLKNVQLVWQGIAESDLNGMDLSASVLKKVEELQRAGAATSGELPALSEEELTASVDSGVYAVYVETACQAPFDRVQIASVVVGEGSDPANVVMPIVPIGAFGGRTQWTSTSTDSAQDGDGTVTWNLYNLPEALDLSSDGPRMVQSYVDIVDEGTRKKTIYLPAPITEVRFDVEKNAWALRADPKEIARTLVDDDLNDRYFEAIDFSISHHADKRTLLFDVEALDQPLNATEGTLRSFPLSNAYPLFADSVTALDASQPGFGVVDVKAVYQHVESISNKDNAEDYRLTLTMPFSSSKSLAVSLGLNPDREFSGSGSMRIDAVQSGGPAAVAGLKAGDLVVGIGGLEIASVGDFYRARFELPAGAPVEIKVLRDGREIALAITPEAIEQ